MEKRYGAIYGYGELGLTIYGRSPCGDFQCNCHVYETFIEDVAEGSPAGKDGRIGIGDQIIAIKNRQEAFLSIGKDCSNGIWYMKSPTVGNSYIYSCLSDKVIVLDLANSNTIILSERQLCRCCQL